MLDKRMVVVSEAAVPLVPDRRETPTNIPIFGSRLCPVSEASRCCFVISAASCWNNLLTPNRLEDLDPLRSQTRGSSRSVSMILVVRASFPACFTHARCTPPTDLFHHHSPPITTWLGSDLMLVARPTDTAFHHSHLIREATTQFCPLQ